MHAVPFPTMFQQYGAGIKKSLRDNLSHQTLDVYDMLRYYMGWADEEGKPHDGMGGKALRPTLCLFACEAAGGNPAFAMPAAVALEFIHNFSLIHDDIQDRDVTRHNRKTLWAIWGDSKAMIAGNVLRVIADDCLHQMLDSGLGYERCLLIADALTQAYLEMIEGQYLDLEYEGRRDISMSDYFNMISRKTGALIRCSFKLGGLVGARDRKVAIAFENSGRALGYVFQIIDDVLGVWGIEKVTGKPVGADIRRKKNSYPLVCAHEIAGFRDSQLLDQIYNKEELDDTDVASVLTVLNRLNIRDHALNRAKTFADQAIDSLCGIDMSSQARENLEELVHFLLVRDR